MSFIYSRALVEEYLQANCLDTELCVQLKKTNIAQAYLCNDKTKDIYCHSRYGMTFAHLTGMHGKKLLTWYLEDFHVKPIQKLLQEKIQQTTFGRKCEGSWQMSLPGTYLPKTSANKQLTKPQTTSRRWVIKSDALNFQRKTWVQTTYGQDIGYLHTPTCTANYSAPSMKKHPSCKLFSLVFWKPSPMNHEWMMGWPIGWSDLKLLETDKFQQWRLQHGNS